MTWSCGSSGGGSPAKTRNRRHAEVRDQHGIVLELDQDELGTAADPLHPAPSQPLAKAVRERKPQVRTAQYDTLQAAPLEGRRQTAADGFDFGQFRHGVSCRVVADRTPRLWAARRRVSKPGLRGPLGLWSGAC